MNTYETLADQFRGARVIVTGAAGFIGLNLVKTLDQMGADVLVIDRTQPSEHFANVEFEWADLRHLNKTYEADFLIHLAAITNAGYAERYPIDTYEVNVLGTINLLNHVEIKKRVLFPSTALVYKASEVPINEDGEMELSSIYAMSKNQAEQFIRFHCRRKGIEFTIVRFFNVYGPGQLPLYIVPQVLRQIIEEKRIVVRNGTVTRDLLYVDDCIDAVLKLVQSPEGAGEAFNIGSGLLVSIADIARQAVQASGMPGVEITDLEQRIEYSPAAIVANVDRVKSVIDWSPDTSLEEGLRQMWRFYTGGN